MFQFSAFAPLRVIYLQYIGLPHSEINGSQIICISPSLIAAYHVLLRLSEPRHSLCALRNLSTSLVFFLLVYYFNQSHYVNVLLTVEDIGVEPMTPCVQGRCSSQLS